MKKENHTLPMSPGVNSKYSELVFVYIALVILSWQGPEITQSMAYPNLFTVLGQRPEPIQPL